MDGSGVVVDGGGVSRSTVPLSSSFAGFRFPPDVILLAVRWYLRYALSYRGLLHQGPSTTGWQGWTMAV